ncbi:IS200/IS605 family transposase [bacterium CPR1]|nr:IS200/IS605 family transposase [bacterium CPR1]
MAGALTPFKYRKPVLVGEVATRTRDLIREVCDRMDVKIMKGHVSKDHVHLFVSVPPRVTISKLLQQLKGKSTYKLLQEFAHLRKTFWGRHFWGRGYFCVSSGNVTDEIVKQYIANQDITRDDEFRVDGEGGP